MKLWFDEDLSPRLVQVVNALGFAATCNRDRGALGCSDADLRPRVQAEDYVFVTDNASDFRPMYARDEVHPGLLVMPAEHGRAGQQQSVRDVIAFVASRAAGAGELPGEFMVNKLVEIEVDGRCSVRDLPPPS